MILKYDPFALIFAQGDEAARLATLDLFALGDSPRASGLLLRLIQQQRADGAFPSSLDAAEWGMRETVRNAILLSRFGLPSDGVNVASAVQFVLRRQRPDGGWSENRSLVIPPQQVELNNEESVTWITADVVELLRRVGMGHSEECRAALDWLRRTQNRHGGWYTYAGSVGDQRGAPGDPDSTAQITFLMGEIYGEDDPVYQRGKVSFERDLDGCARDAERGYRIRFRDGERDSLDGYGLTLLFLSWLFDPPRRFRSGYDVSDPRVARIMEALVDIQRDDGGWRPFWAEESSPLHTALAVKALVLGGMVAREELEAGLRPYAT